MSVPRRGIRPPGPDAPLEQVAPVSPTWSARALRDLDEIQDHIADDDPRAAERWALVLWDAASAAARRPAVGRMVPEFRRPDVREVLRGAYRVIYLVRGASIFVLTVFEGHKLLPSDVRRVIDRHTRAPGSDPGSDAG